MIQYQVPALTELENIATGLLIYRKLNRVSASELGSDVTVGSDPKTCQGIEGDLHNKVFFDNPHA